MSNEKLERDSGSNNSRPNISLLTNLFNDEGADTYQNKCDTYLDTCRSELADRIKKA